MNAAVNFPWLLRDPELSIPGKYSNLPQSLYFLAKAALIFAVLCHNIKDSPSITKITKFQFDKGRSRISMVWVPLLGFDPYCEGEWLPLQDEFTPSINSEKNFLQKLQANFEKSKNQIFSKTAQPILMTKIYVIEGTREVVTKIQEPIPLTRRR